MDLPKFSTLTLTYDDELLAIAINRPEALGALSENVVAELAAALEFVRGHCGEGSDWSIRTVILTGTGDKAFVAGADIREMSAMSESEATQYSIDMARVTTGFEELPVPVIACVKGFALGGGCELALAADWILACENAVFGQPEVKLGLVPGFGGTARLPRRIGPAAASEMILTGESIGAARALEIGLVQAVLGSSSDLMEAARVQHDRIKAASPRAIARAKSLLRASSSLPLVDALKTESLVFGENFGSADAAEGTHAFLEKRKPGFTGA